MSDERLQSDERLNLSEIVEELKENFTKYKNSHNKKEIIKGVIENENMNELLVSLCEKDLDEILIYILNNFSLETKSNEHNDLFFLAISKKKFSVVQSLINNQYVNALNARDDEGNTGLILSAIYSDVQTTKLLLKAYPDLVEMKNKVGIDALTISVYNNDNLLFFLLINNLTFSIYNLNELCRLAIRNESLDILEHLTHNKSFAEDPLLLHHACAQKNLNIFNYVLSLTTKFDDVDSNGETPLHWAVLRGTYHIAHALLKVYKDNHLNVNAKSKFGITAFHLALIKQDKNVSKLLFEHGADANEADKEGNTVIHMMASIGDLKWLKYIIKHFNVNCYQKNVNGNTPFVEAVLNGRINIVEYFIDKIPNLNWKNKLGQTALHAAVFANHIKIVELLLKNKADITVKDINDLTPYHYAYVEKKTEMIKVIHSLLKLDRK